MSCANQFFTVHFIGYLLAYLILFSPSAALLPFRYTSILVNKSGEKVNFFVASLQFTSMKYGYNILVNKSGEKVDFFAASLQFTSMKFSYNILVNKSGEKVHFFSASLQFTSIRYSYNIRVKNRVKK